MSNIHDIFKDEDVNGVIIGDILSIGYLCYDGRQQGRQLYADSIEQLKAKANDLVLEFKEDNKEILWHVYPDDSLWSLRIVQ